MSWQGIHAAVLPLAVRGLRVAVTAVTAAIVVLLGVRDECHEDVVQALVRTLFG